MRVILTAFGGRLKSEPMDWPEGQDMTIQMYMDTECSMHRNDVYGFTIGHIFVSKPKLVEFKFSGETVDDCNEYRFTGKIG